MLAEKDLCIQESYYTQNKQRILRDLKIKIRCNCGSVISKSSLLPHLQTAKHKTFLSIDGPRRHNQLNIKKKMTVDDFTVRFD